MKVKCPYCTPNDDVSGPRPKVYRAGKFKRKSDSRVVPRFRCTGCGKHFSRATAHPYVRQKKRQLNTPLIKLLCSGVSLRRCAKILNLSRTTVVRKAVLLGELAMAQLAEHHLSKPQAEVVEFDDMETFEHTKCKPLSITLAVESRTRRILGFEVAQMPAKGKLAPISRKKYGPRPDQRQAGRERLFEKLKPLIKEDALIKSDQNPHYGPDVKKHFPNATHEVHKGQRGSIVGQGELKKIRFDPLFSLNHTCAMFRANVNRLIRKTWCTTKLPERLAGHLAMYALFHNLHLIQAQ
ncbi:MAG: transposase [Bdellovibrionales bacterium]